MEISGKNVLITGGLGGFGFAIATALKELGANIFVFDIRENEEFKCFKVDVTDEQQVKQALAQIEKIDVLINCAGEIYSEPFINVMSKGDKRHSRESWDRVINNNLTSVFNMSVQVSEKMAAKRTKGVIISFSSISAQGNAGQVAYSAAKAGIESMTKVIAKEMGMFKIRAVAIAPGFIDTPSTRKAMTEAMLDYWKRQTPMRKLGQLDDIIETIKYIIKNDYLSGCTIPVDGALTL